MIRIRPICLLLAFVSASLSADPPLKDARRRWLRGDNAGAMDKYQAALKDPALAVEASLGVSRCHETKGEYDKALEAIETCLKDHAKDAQLLARKAELLYFRGNWTEAEQAANAAIAQDKEQFIARFVLAQVYRDRGELKKADDAFRWMVRTFSERSEKDKDVTNPEHLTAIGMAGTENARWHKLSDQFEVILHDVYGDALKNDRDYWPAEYQAGMLLLEKYNRADGLAALDKALTINPSAALALAGKGVAALQRLEIRDAERFADQALKINPNLPEALRLRADVHLTTGDTAAALKALESARAVNGRDEQTLGRIAACLWLDKKQDEFNALIAKVQANNSTPGLFHFILGERLEERKRFAEAEAQFKKARQYRPMLHQATANLGMMYMRLGNEKEGAKLLDEAFDADPFNVRVSNMRKVLKHLESYKTLKTAHYELRYDATTDAALARWMADYLERIYDELSAKFQHKMQGPILIEVFNNHEKFSGRTIALPDLHTIGACTGRMIAMVSPQGQGVGKQFNWGRVLRHEVVHIFNLDQTQFLVPHWLTEGLAVTNEKLPRPQQWNQLLRTRVPAGELMSLDNIDLGFIRPRSPQDWAMAYCQSQLYVEYLTKTYGERVIGELLNAYRDGLDTDAVIRKVCKVERAAFEQAYRQYLKEVVQGLGGNPVEKQLTYSELQDAHRQNPDDLDLAARFAEQQIRRDRNAARELAQKILDKKPKHPLASVVLARLAVLGGDTKKARDLLEAALDRANPDVKLVRALGKLCYDAGDLERAAEMFELGRKAEPQDSEWLTELAKVYARLEKTDKQIEVLRELVKADADDLDGRKRLIRLLASANKPIEVERYAREALEINVRDKEVREALYKALESQPEELTRVKKLLEG